MSTSSQNLSEDSQKIDGSPVALGDVYGSLQGLGKVIFDRADCAIIIVDPHGFIRHINPACSLITGFSEEDLVGKSYIETMTPEPLVPAAQQKLEDIVRSKEPVHCESPWLRKDGSTCLLKGSFSTVLLPNGEIDYIIGIGVDVTEERSAQAELEKSKSRFELAVAGSQDGVWDVDVRTGERYYSPRWKEILGFEDHELPNTRETWWTRIHPDDLGRVRQYQDNYKHNPEVPHQVEFRMRHRDGSWRWISSRGKAIFDEEGQTIRVAGSHKDITQRKLDELALRESETRLLEAQDIADLGTWELDFQTGKIWWSPQTYRIYGIDPSSPPPTMPELLETVHPDDKEMVRSNIQHTTLTGAPYRVKRRIFRPNGELRHVVTTARILHDSEGNQSKVVGVVQDVTEQQLAEDAILNAREQALEASRLKSEFLANMSHEIRTPMNGVIGMAEILLGSNLTQEQQKCAFTIRTSAEGLMTILNDILDFSKIEAGKLNLEEEDVDILEIVEDVATIVGLAAHEKRLDLLIDAEYTVSSSYRGDSTRIRQILTNLASNAVKFTNRGQITIGLRTSEEGIQLWVEDTGLGIAEERHRAIFESFTQADGSTTRQFGGTGLGLAIVRQLVDLMKGSVALQSEPGKGSRFDVFLPLEPSSVSQPTHILEQHAVILVSQNFGTVGRLRHMFEGLGAAFIAVNNTQDVSVTSLQKDHTVTVLVDQSTIPESTWNILQSLVSDSTKLVLLSSTVTAPPPGFDGCINLPVTRRTLEYVLLSNKDLTSGVDSTTEPFSGMRALLAEDNVVNQKVAEHQLERIGFQVDIVSNGKEAVEKADQTLYDVILMDVQMPEMDGLTATGLIRSNNRHPKQPTILAMTAHAMQGDRERCIDAGMDDYISKPVHSGELVDKLMMWLKPESKQASKVDWNYLQDMSGGDPEVIKQILRIYVSAMPDVMKQLLEACHTQSYSAMNRLSHTLKGSSLSIGANSFADMCQEIESISESNQPYRHVDRCEKFFNDLIAECQHFIDS